ncbi:MAG: HEPN domain-containing protein [Omnitrophica WOR_2 bacterium]
MNPSNPLLEKAERFIHSARVLTEEGDYDSAASRLYYAMLFTAQALLAARDLSFSSHRAVISAYGQHFAKTNALDPIFHKSLMTAFNQRQLGDYTVDSGIRKEDVEALSLDATAFIKAAKDWLKKNQQST